MIKWHVILDNAARKKNELPRPKGRGIDRRPSLQLKQADLHTFIVF